MQILGTKIWALGGLNQKIEEQLLWSAMHGELIAKNGSIPSRNKKEEAI